MLSHTDGCIDRGAYWRDASEDVIRACAIATFGEPNKEHSNGADLRFGSHGSKSVALHGDMRGSTRNSTVNGSGNTGTSLYLRQESVRMYSGNAWRGA